MDSPDRAAVDGSPTGAWASCTSRWTRAAELQADAASRLEERSQALSELDLVEEAQPAGGGLHARFVGRLPAFLIAYDLYYWADVKEVRLRIGALGEGRCRVVVAADMGRTKRLNLWVGAPLVGGAALAVGLAGTALLAGLLGPAAAFAAGGGLVAGTWMQGTRGWRAIARHGVGKEQKALHQLLRALDGHLASDGRYVPGSGTFPPLPAPGD